ncbi:MAG: hypothetical protein R3Y33_06235, partial [Clostridia bacterium]
HQHPDNLSYIYAEGKDYLTCEDGYNRNILADNHNVLLVDGEYSDVTNVSDVYVDSAKERLKNNSDTDIVNNYTAEVYNIEIKDSTVLYQAETTKIYPEKFLMKEVSRSFFTDDLSFMVFVNRFSSENEHKYSVINNTCELAEKISDNEYQYNLNKEELIYSVYSEELLEKKQYEQNISAVMTTQEPDKKCTTLIKTLKSETKEKCKSSLVFEVYAQKGTKIEYQPHKIVVYGKKKYTIIAKEAFNRYGISSDRDIEIKIENI